MVFLFSFIYQSSHFPMKLRTILSGLLLLSLSVVNATEPVNLIPSVHGVVRARYEIETDGGLNRFQVRNARVNVAGKIAPVISYFVQIDACDRGKITFLDAWGRFDVSKALYIQGGQFRQPFGVDNFRLPGGYYFANRSFLGKIINNYRGVGAKAGWAPVNIPLDIQAGFFNQSAIGDHNVWNKSVAFASKVTWKPGNMMLSTGYQSMKRTSHMSYYDATVGWGTDGWYAEAEYMGVAYSHDAAPTCHTWVTFVTKSFPVKAGIFNKASVMARYDGMTNYSNGAVGDDGLLSVTEPRRQRATIGGQLSYVYKSVHADLRLNYEKFWYPSAVQPMIGDRDKIVAEMVIKF